MSKTSNVGDLMARLQQKIEQDRIEIEALTQSELKKLAEKLEAERARRVVYHRARYQGAHPVDERGAVGGVGVGAWWAGCVSFLGICVRELGPDAVVFQQHPKPHPEAGRFDAPGRAGADTARSASGADVGGCGSTRRRTGRGP